MATAAVWIACGVLALFVIGVLLLQQGDKDGRDSSKAVDKWPLTHRLLRNPLLFPLAVVVAPITVLVDVCARLP